MYSVYPEAPYARELDLYRRDSRGAIASYRVRRFFNGRIGKVLVYASLPLFILARFGKRKSVSGSVVAGFAFAGLTAHALA